MVVIIERRGHADSSVERDLKHRHGEASYENIRRTSQLKEVFYCQSPLIKGWTAGMTTLFKKGSGDGTYRPPRKPGSVNHDFIVLKMTGEVSEGVELPFYIVAEKSGGGLAGSSHDGAGIHIQLLQDNEAGHIDDNLFASWDCESIRVPLDVLVQKLKDLDPNYSFLLNNCWTFAKEACKSVLLFLSEQPHLNLRSKIYWQLQAQTVKTRVTVKATCEAVTRASRKLGELSGL